MDFHHSYYCGDIFGVKKIPELARSFGKATAEYEKARIEAKKELEQIKVKIRWDVRNLKN